MAKPCCCGDTIISHSPPISSHTDPDPQTTLTVHHTQRPSERDLCVCVSQGMWLACNMSVSEACRMSCVCACVCARVCMRHVCVCMCVHARACVCMCVHWCVHVYSKASDPSFILNNLIINHEEGQLPSAAAAAATDVSTHHFTQRPAAPLLRLRLGWSLCASSHLTFGDVQTVLRVSISVVHVTGSTCISLFYEVLLSQKQS